MVGEKLIDDRDLNRKRVRAQAVGPGSRPPGVPSPPQKTRPRLSADFIAAHKKQRLACAAADLICEQGLTATTVDQISTRARVGRMTFYQCFANKAECIDWASAEAARRLFAAAEEAGSAEAPGSERRAAVIEALLEAAAANPSLAELCLLHSLVLRDPASGHDRAVEALASLLECGWVPAAEAEGPSLAAEMVAGAILAIVATRLRRGEATGLPALHGELVELSTAQMPPRAEVAADADADLLALHRSHRAGLDPARLTER